MVVIDSIFTDKMLILMNILTCQMERLSYGCHLKVVAAAKVTACMIRPGRRMVCAAW